MFVYGFLGHLWVGSSIVLLLSICSYKTQLICLFYFCVWFHRQWLVVFWDNGNILVFHRAKVTFIGHVICNKFFFFKWYNSSLSSLQAATRIKVSMFISTGHYSTVCEWLGELIVWWSGGTGEGGGFFSCPGQKTRGCLHPPPNKSPLIGSSTIHLQMYPTRSLVEH